MKHCTNCGGEIADDAKFCTWCGSTVATMVPVVPVQAATTAAAAVAAEPTPKPYSPAQVTVNISDTSAQTGTYGTYANTGTAAASGTYPSSAAGYTQTYGQQTYGQQVSTQQTYGQPTYTQPTYATNASAGVKKSDGLGIAAIVFMVLSSLMNLGAAASSMGDGSGMGGAYLIAAIIAIVLTVMLVKKVKSLETIPTWFKVVTLIFGSLISGILLFVRKEDQLR